MHRYAFYTHDRLPERRFADENVSAHSTAWLVKLGYNPKQRRLFAQIGPSVYSSPEYYVGDLVHAIVYSDQTHLRTFTLIPGEIRVPRQGRGTKVPIQDVVPVSQRQLRYLQDVLTCTMQALPEEIATSRRMHEAAVDRINLEEKTRVDAQRRIETEKEAARRTAQRERERRELERQGIERETRQTWSDEERRILSWQRGTRSFYIG